MVLLLTTSNLSELDQLKTLLLTEISNYPNNSEDGTSTTASKDGLASVLKSDGETFTMLNGILKSPNLTETPTSRSPNSSPSTQSSISFPTTHNMLLLEDKPLSTLSNSTTLPEETVLQVLSLPKLMFFGTMSLLLVWFPVTTKFTISLVKSN